jgi:hypothetical protein
LAKPAADTAKEDNRLGIPCQIPVQLPEESTNALKIQLKNLPAEPISQIPC